VCVCVCVCVCVHVCTCLCVRVCTCVGLLQHGYGSPEAEPAAVQKARAKLLEPEDGSRIPGGSAPLQESELEIQSHPKNGFEGAFGWHVPPTARPTNSLPWRLQAQNRFTTVIERAFCARDLFCA